MGGVQGTQGNPCLVLCQEPGGRCTSWARGRGLPMVGCCEGWNGPHCRRLQPPELRVQCTSWMISWPSMPLSHVHTDMQLCYFQTHHCPSHFCWGPGAPESGRENPAERKLTAHSWTALKARLWPIFNLSTGKHWRCLKQEKDILPSWGLKVEVEIESEKKVTAIIQALLKTSTGVFVFCFVFKLGG